MPHAIPSTCVTPSAGEFYLAHEAREEIKHNKSAMDIRARVAELLNLVALGLVPVGSQRDERVRIRTGLKDGGRGNIRCTTCC